MHKKLIREDIKHLREVRDRLDREKKHHEFARYEAKEKQLSKVHRQIQRL